MIFARSNKTNEPITIKYSYKDTNSLERSVTYSASLSGKFKKNIKGIDTEINGKIDNTVKKVTSRETVEVTDFTITIQPNKKVVFRETGECLVTNGVSKYYFLWLTLNKGSWEYIDIVTRYYELYEEDN